MPYKFRLAYCGDENIQHVQDALTRCAKSNSDLQQADQNILVVNRQSWKSKIKHPELFNLQMDLTFDFNIELFRKAVTDGTVDEFFLMVHDNLSAIVARSRGN